MAENKVIHYRSSLTLPSVYLTKRKPNMNGYFLDWEKIYKHFSVIAAGWCKTYVGIFVYPISTQVSFSKLNLLYLSKHMERTTQHTVKVCAFCFFVLIQMSMGFWMKFSHSWNRTWKLWFHVSLHWHIWAAHLTYYTAWMKLAKLQAEILNIWFPLMLSPDASGHRHVCQRWTEGGINSRRPPPPPSFFPP